MRGDKNWAKRSKPKFHDEWNVRGDMSISLGMGEIDTGRARIHSKYPWAQWSWAPSAPALYNTSAPNAHLSTRSYFTQRIEHKLKAWMILGVVMKILTLISSRVSALALENVIRPKSGHWLSEDDTGSLCPKVDRNPIKFSKDNHQSSLEAYCMNLDSRGLTPYAGLFLWRFGVHHEWVARWRESHELWLWQSLV